MFVMAANLLHILIVIQLSVSHLHLFSTRLVIREIRFYLQASLIIHSPTSAIPIFDDVPSTNKEDKKGCLLLFFRLRFREI